MHPNIISLKIIASPYSIFQFKSENFYNSGYVERKVPVARYKEGSSGDRKNSGGVNYITRYGEIKKSSLHEGKVVNGLPYPNGKHVHNKSIHVDQFKAYNQCLQGGR